MFDVLTEHYFSWIGQSSRVGNQDCKSDSSNVLYEMFPMDQYQPPWGKKIWIYHFSADLI